MYNAHRLATDRERSEQAAHGRRAWQRHRKTPVELEVSKLGVEGGAINRNSGGRNQLPCKETLKHNMNQVVKFM